MFKRLTAVGCCWEDRWGQESKETRLKGYGHWAGDEQDEDQGSSSDGMSHVEYRWVSYG